jgi:hypothetical protein
MIQLVTLFIIFNTKYYIKIIPEINDREAQFPYSTKVCKLITLMYTRAASIKLIVNSSIRRFF